MELSRMGRRAVPGPVLCYLRSVVGAALGELEAVPLSVEGLQRMIGRLPAEARAQLARAAAALPGSLSSFLDGAMDEPALARLASELGLVVGPWSAASSLVAQPALLRDELEAVWRSDESLLRASLDPSSADAAEWTIRSWITCVDLSRSDRARSSMHAALKELRRVLGSDDAAALDEGLARRGWTLRVQALLMAAIEGVREGRPQAVVGDLVLRAFDEMDAVTKQLRAAGLRVDPFEGETLAQRAERARRYAAHIRNALKATDMASFDEARLRQLR
jgi:hypothetical protein